MEIGFVQFARKEETALYPLPGGKVLCYLAGGGEPKVANFLIFLGFILHWKRKDWLTWGTMVHSCLGESFGTSFVMNLHCSEFKVRLCFASNKCVSDFAPASLLWVEVANLLRNVDKGGNHLIGGEVSLKSTTYIRSNLVFKPWLCISRFILG